MRRFIGKVGYDSVWIEDIQVQTGIRSTPAQVLFTHICIITVDDISKYKETCKVPLDYPKIGGGSIKECAREDIRNILRANIDVHSRRLIADFPGDGIKCI